MTEQEDGDVGREVRVDEVLEVAAPERRVRRAGESDGDEERGGRRRHGDDLGVVADEVAGREEELREPLERDDVQRDERDAERRRPGQETKYAP